MKKKEKDDLKSLIENRNDLIQDLYRLTGMLDSGKACGVNVGECSSMLFNSNIIRKAIIDQMGVYKEDRSGYIDRLIADD